MSDKIIQLNEELIKHDLKELVRSSAEEALNALLDKEADELVNARKSRGVYSPSNLFIFRTPCR